LNEIEIPEQANPHDAAHDVQPAEEECPICRVDMHDPAPYEYIALMIRTMTAVMTKPRTTVLLKESNGFFIFHPPDTGIF
jgi:hypothetical protein